MARAAARLERRGALTPRDRVWAAIRATGTPTAPDFSIAELALLTQQHIDTVATYVNGLIAAGYLQVTEKARPANRPQRALWLLRLARDTGAEAPRVTEDGKPVTAGQGREQMWLSLRVLKNFSAEELALAASTPQHAVAVEEARTYLVHLKKAGYVVETAPASRRGGKARYAFIKSRNTGPRAPLVCRDRSVMDGNTGETVWPR